MCNLLKLYIIKEKAMKTIFKASLLAVATSLMLTANYTSAFAAHSSNSSAYYDVQQAGDYVLAFCGANEAGYTMPETRDFTLTEVFCKMGADCTNYVSQALYYGGYKMEGSPSITFWIKNRILGSNCGNYDDDEWFYYKLKDNFDVSHDTWSSTWSRVEGKSEAGLYNYLSRKSWFNDPLCSCDSNLEYCDDFAKKYNVKRGDIIQIDFSSDGSYDHSTFVWCTEPEIRLCYHSNYVWAKKLSEIEKSLNNGAQKPSYRVIHTTDHAKTTSRIW